MRPGPDLLVRSIDGDPQGWEGGVRRRVFEFAHGRIDQDGDGRPCPLGRLEPPQHVEVQAHPEPDCRVAEVELQVVRSWIPESVGGTVEHELLARRRSRGVRPNGCEPDGQRGRDAGRYPHAGPRVPDKTVGHGEASVNPEFDPVCGPGGHGDVAESGLGLHRAGPSGPSRRRRRRKEARLQSVSVRSI